MAEYANTTQLYSSQLYETDQFPNLIPNIQEFSLQAFRSIPEGAAEAPAPTPVTTVTWG